MEIPFPSFTYHEALLISQCLLQDLGLRRLYDSSDTSRPVEDTQQAAANIFEEDRQAIVSAVTDAISSFRESLPETFEQTFLFDVDKEKLLEKLEGLEDLAQTRLFFAIGWLFWHSHESETEVDALCGAGLLSEHNRDIYLIQDRLDKKFQKFKRRARVTFPKAKKQ
jgi:hypothetical protein